MAEIAEVQIMKPRNVTMGGDTHKGVTQVAYTLNKANLYPVYKEDDMVPSAYEQIRSNQPAVIVRITTMNTAAMTGLLEEAAGALTLEGKVPGTAGEKLFTFANLQWRTGQGGIQNERAGEHTLEGWATGLTIGDVV